MPPVSGIPLTPSLGRAYRVGRSITLVDGPIALVDPGGATLELSGELVISDGDLILKSSTGTVELHNPSTSAAVVVQDPDINGNEIIVSVANGLLVAGAGSVAMDVDGSIDLMPDLDVIISVGRDVTIETTDPVQAITLVHPAAGSISLGDPGSGIGIGIVGDPVGGGGSVPVPSWFMIPIGVAGPLGVGPAIHGSSDLWAYGDLNDGKFMHVMDSPGGAFTPVPFCGVLHDVFATATPDYAMVFGSVSSGTGGGILTIERPPTGSGSIFFPGPIDTDFIGLTGDPTVNGKNYMFGDFPGGSSAVAGRFLMLSSGVGSFFPTGEPVAYLEMPTADPWTIRLGARDGGGPPDMSPELELTSSTAFSAGTSPSGLPIRASLSGGRRAGPLPTAVLLGKTVFAGGAGPTPPHEVVFGGHMLFDSELSTAVGVRRIGSDPAVGPGTVYGRPRTINVIQSVTIGQANTASLYRNSLDLIAATGGTAKMPYIRTQNLTGTDYFLWVDATGDLRIDTAAPTDATDLGGTVVGTQV